MNQGFRVGLIGGVTTAFLHLLLPFFSGGQAWGELLAWLLQIFVYIFAAGSAAEAQYRRQMYDAEPFNGIPGAGVGAALITSLITWLFILVRAVILDASGAMVIVEPISLYCIVVLDVSAALGIGSWRGRQVLKKYIS